MAPVTAEPEPEMNNEPSQSGKQIVGIIYPPPEIRNIVDKTASFVARNGFEFESRIKANEAGNAKFNFLNPTDPYHAYYQSKVKDFQEGKSLEPTSGGPPTAGPKVPQKIQDAVKAAEMAPKEPPPELEFSAEPATINAFDLDLIQLTALFVARNGRQFLTALMGREARNYQFDFLKPQHSNFPFFTKLVEQYTKVLIPPKDVKEKLREETEKPEKVLSIVKYRVEWEREQRRLREREAAEMERERLAYASIDWHDFVVVQTVDFSPGETLNLPPPCTPKDVGARVLAQQRVEQTKLAATQNVEMEMEGDSDEEKEKADGEDDVTVTRVPVPVVAAAPAAVEEEEEIMPPPKPQDAQQVHQPMPAPQMPGNVVVRDYDPRLAREKASATAKAGDKWIISPLTGERVPADKLADHMRYNTVDSQYYEKREREREAADAKAPIYAPGVDISSNIKAFAERRSDIFGVGEKGAEQTMIGKKIGDDEEEAASVPNRPPQAVPSAPKSWDTNPVSNILVQQQIAEIRKATGMGSGPSGEPRAPAPPPPVAAPPPPKPAPPAPPPAARPPAPPPAPPPVQLNPFQTQAMPRPPVMVPMGMMPLPGIRAPTMQIHNPLGILAAQSMAAQAAAAMAEGEPSAKKARTEETLVPEQEWLIRHGGEVTLQVACPTAEDKPEWNLKGQMLHLKFALNEPVSVLKQRIQDETGLPVSKQKLQFESMFIKDAASLAYYNMENASVVHLQFKERGGRKR